MSEQTLPSLDVIDLGLMPYGDALAAQETFHAAVVQGRRGVILTVEHPPVLTMGKNSDQSHLLFSREDYRSQGVEFFETERGGEVTAHVPGQLVVYPIIPIHLMGLNTRSYVDLLEQSVIDVLSRFQIDSSRDPEHPGVWVKESKICAIGVRIKEKVSMHGLALNVDNSLDLFGKIVPCGIRARGVTTMSQVSDGPVNFGFVKESLVSILTKRFESNQKT